MKGAFRIPVYQGGGGGNPDPAVYCPINGFIPDPEVFRPQFPIPESSDESLIFICNAVYGNWDLSTRGWQHIRNNTGGSYAFVYELYDMSANLLDTWSTTGTGYDFAFPTNDTQYVLKIKLSGLDSNGNPNTFNQFYTSASSVPPWDCCITSCIVNSPNIKNLRFEGMRYFTMLEFTVNPDQINSFYRTFYECPKVEYFKFPTDVPNLIRIDAMFSYSGIRKIDLRNVTFYNNGTVQFLANNFVANTNKLTDLYFPNYFPVSRAYNLIQNTPRLASFQMFTDHDGLIGFSSTTLNYAFSNTVLEGELIIPECPLVTYVTSMFQYSAYLTKVVMLGNWGSLVGSSSNNLFSGCSRIQEIEMPRITNAGTATGTVLNDTACTALRIYKGADIGFAGLPVANSPLQSITGESDTSGFASLPTVALPTGALVRAALTEFQMVKLRVQRFTCGNSVATKFTVLTTLEIDWTNSTFANATSPQLSISAALSATEINRILTALPTVVGKTADFRYCDGYATCDKTIATAKGWTML